MTYSVHMPNPVDAKRSKQRINLVLDEDERELAEGLAEKRRVSLSQLVGQLIREEAAREKRRR